MDAPAPSAATTPVPTHEALLRLWSDPLPAAHRDWCSLWPATLLQRAAQVPQARRAVARALRSAVPLRPLSSLEGEAVAPWALGSPREIFARADEAGWLLMRGWIARAVRRADVQALTAFLGRERYEQALEAAPTLWHDAGARPDPPFTVPAAQLQQVFRGLGFRALNQALGARCEALRGRMRLLAGHQAATPDTLEPLPLDDDALLAQLRGASEAASA